MARLFGTRNLKRALSTALAVCLLVTAAPSFAMAETLPTDRVGGYAVSTPLISDAHAPDISARAGVLIGLNGRALWARRAGTQRPMASTTKIMTALVVLERSGLDEVVTISRAAAATPYATGLRAGERRTVRQLLELLLVASSNDAANALAVHSAGSTRSFVSLMNRRAASLQMEDTRYVNAHGLDATGHYSSASDLTRVMRAALRQAEFRRIIHLSSVVLPRYGRRAAQRIRNTNELLGEVRGMIGGKTGYTGDARYGLVASARRDGLTLTSVVLGSPTSSARFTSTRRLFEWGFRYYRLRSLSTTTQTAGYVPISGDMSRTAPARYASAVNIPVFSLLGPVSRVPSLQTSVTVPVFAGQPLGTVRFVQNASVIATSAVVAAKPVASVGETVGAVPILGRPGVTVIARAAESTAVVVPYDVTRPVERTVELLEGVATPVMRDQWLGWIDYSQDGRLIVRVPAVAASVVD